MNKFDNNNLFIKSTDRKKKKTKTDSHIIPHESEHTSSLQKSNYIRIDDDISTFIDQKN